MLNVKKLETFTIFHACTSLLAARNFGGNYAPKFRAASRLRVYVRMKNAYWKTALRSLITPPHICYHLFSFIKATKKLAFHDKPQFKLTGYDIYIYSRKT